MMVHRGAQRMKEAPSLGRTLALSGPVQAERGESLCRPLTLTSRLHAPLAGPTPTTSAYVNGGGNGLLDSPGQ